MTAAKQSSASVADPDTTVVVITEDGKMSQAQANSAVPASSEEPAYPAGAPGTKHKISGVIHDVKCTYPAVLTLTLDLHAKPLKLYSNNYFKIPFSTLGYAAKGDLSPCTAIEGMKANIVYGEVTDARVAGQIVSVELVK